MSKFKFLPILAGVAALGFTALPTLPASAGIPDDQDFQIFVCSGCTSAPGGDPNFINQNSFSIGTAQGVTNPLLVLIGEPGTPATAPILSVPSGVTAAAASAYYGLTTATTGTLTGALETSSFTSGVAYDTVGLAGGVNSQSFVNWTTTPFPNGESNPDAGVTSFSIYAVAVDTAGGFSGTTSGFDLSNVESGSFVFAYGCQTAPSPTTNTCGTTMDNVGSTPFTNSGFVPAPPIGHGLLVLLAIGGVLSGSKLMENRKKRQLHTA